ncbi:hypothetical protein PLEI_3041 [Photobacterium leiognathi lrivu.4.1]|uniref:Uncharacterized protein n=1 Tax=Photobacterium leiognathi lrivu.4.1 TaxID=1248232 RepID=V5F612_PHOLE|nr:hypothetical protein PLEI_3041 [Photobacterium leiognathi lrivu.4.1]
MLINSFTVKYMKRCASSYSILVTKAFNLCYKNVSLQYIRFLNIHIDYALYIHHFSPLIIKVGFFHPGA